MQKWHARIPVLANFRFGHAKFHERMVSSGVEELSVPPGIPSHFRGKCSGIFSLGEFLILGKAVCSQWNHPEGFASLGGGDV